MYAKLTRMLRRVLPPAGYRFVKALRHWQDMVACVLFISAGGKLSIRERIKLVKKLYVISINIDSSHTQKQMLEYIKAILSLPSGIEGVLVEAGCYKGSSTAKLSLAADMIGKDLVVFDSFQGLPEHNEPHDRNIYGVRTKLEKGGYRGTLEEVRENVRRFGKIDRCRFMEGWFDSTMPEFKKSVSAAFLDVDLASSTRTCLKYLYPLLETGGVLYSHDGDLPLVTEVYNDSVFWLKEVGCEKPLIKGLGKTKLIKVIKSA